MRRIFALFLILVLTVPQVGLTSSDEPLVSVSETVIYIVDLNPLTGSSTVEYKSTITVKNEGQSRVEHRFTQRIIGVNASTLVLPREARLTQVSEDVCLVEWLVQADPGTKILEVSGKPLFLPVWLNASLKVNGAEPNYTSAYGAFFINSKEGDAAEWTIRLRNNNPVLLNPLTNTSSKPPLFVSVSITLPDKYFGNIVFTPPVNMTSPFEKDSASWLFILQEDAEINVKAVVKGFDDWGTIPLTPISISFSPMEESVIESMRSQMVSLNMSMVMMGMILSPLSNLTGLTSLMQDMLGNLSYGLKTMGNQTVVMSDALRAISSGLGSAVSQLSQAALLLSSITENISKVNFSQLQQELASSRQVAEEFLNWTYSIVIESENDLLEINNTLTTLRNDLTDPDQIALVDNAITRINILYSRLKNVESQLDLASSQLDPVFESLMLFLNTLEEYRSNILTMGSGLSSGVSSLSQVSSALYDVSSALKLIGEANIMMGENLTSVISMLENATSGLEKVQNSLNENVTSLRKAYDELSMFLMLMEYKGNRTRLLAPELQNGGSIIFQPVLNDEASFLKLNALIFSNDTRIGVRSVKVGYTGSFEGVLLNGSRYLSDPSLIGIRVSGGSVIIEPFRFYDKGNVLTIWSGQDVSLLFSKDSEITVDVDYSMASSLGDRSEALSYSIIQPTFGKAVNITVKPGETTPPLKTGLTVIVILLSAVSIIIVIVLVYALRRKEEIIVA
ncbi:MAG: hypothetical protein ACP5PQ_04070 [Thermoproteota archaeon]